MKERHLEVMSPQIDRRDELETPTSSRMMSPESSRSRRGKGDRGNRSMVEDQAMFSPGGSKRLPSIKDQSQRRQKKDRSANSSFAKPEASAGDSVLLPYLKDPEDYSELLKVQEEDSEEKPFNFNNYVKTSKKEKVVEPEVELVDPVPEPEEVKSEILDSDAISKIQAEDDKSRNTGVDVKSQGGSVNIAKPKRTNTGLSLKSNGSKKSQRTGSKMSQRN